MIGRSGQSFARQRKRDVDPARSTRRRLATTGAHDFMLQVVAADLESFGTLVLKKLLKVPGVRDVQSSLVLDTLKRSARIPLSHLLPQSKLAPP